MCKRSRSAQSILTLVVLSLGFTAPRPLFAQDLPRAKEDPRDLSRFERTLFGVAIAGLNIGCGVDPRAAVPPDQPLQQELSCADRGTDLGRLFAAQLAAYPTAAPAGGFTFSFDRAARAFIRSSKSFGPSFAERPITNGSDRLAIGFTTQHITFNGIDDRSFDGELLNQRNFRRAGPLGNPFGGPLEENFGAGDTNAFIALDASNTVAFASYGISNRVDVTIVVPTRQVDLSIYREQQRDRCNAITDIPEAQAVGPVPCLIVRPFRPFRRVATGLGDIALRLKHNFLRYDAFALAYTVEISLPTADEQEFLGTGKVGARTQLLASASIGSISPIFNLGYHHTPNALASFQSQGRDFTTQNREVSYAAGADVGIGGRFTAAVLVLGRYFLDLRSIVEVEQLTGLTFTAGPGSTPEFLFFRQLDLPVGRRIHQMIGNAGLKWNVARHYLITANVLVPLTKQGLRSRWAPVLGLDYTF